MTAKERQMQDSIDNLELEVSSLNTRLDELAERVGSWPDSTKHQTVLDALQEHDTRIADLEQAE